MPSYIHAWRLSVCSEIMGASNVRFGSLHHIVCTEIFRNLGCVYRRYQVLICFQHHTTCKTKGEFCSMGPASREARSVAHTWHVM